MKIWAAGACWPVRDGVELDLVAAGWVALTSAQTGHQGHETLRLTELGVHCLAEARRLNRRALSAHDALAARMTRELLLAGRVVWRELSLRAQGQGQGEGEAGAEAQGQHDPDAEFLLAPQTLAAAVPKPQWRVARPDVFSVRNTSVEDYLQPVVHEIKVSRADLLSDLRHAAKRDAYQWLCSECYYVFPVGVAEAAEIPEAFGVWVLHGAVEDGRLELLRPARHKPCKLPFAVWLALAKATPARLEEDPAQRQLASSSEGDTT
ncbi:hypothetical protein [Roseateles albus]|uniref:DUF3883 domain-containing protein n=1 Tax=Roseateles albus TaxID=2987525 RepID=A0ABT5KE66_9BURK|nr:hypothetical protein [Roseateles albus]MDC8771829.1 hypothetical protein [Roseateles albus]